MVIRPADPSDIPRLLQLLLQVGQGIATALYRHICGVAREMGCRFVTLNVWCGNDTAMHFYEKAGLRPRNIMMEMPLEELEC